jgi:hypothetical protein
MLLGLIVFSFGCAVWCLCVISVSRELKHRRDVRHEWRATIRRTGDPLHFVIVGILAILVPVGIEVAAWLAESGRFLPDGVLLLSFFLGFVVIGIGIENGAERPVRYRAYDVGITSGRWLQTIVPWSHYNGYRVNGECLVLDGRWTFDRRLDRESIDEVDAVVATLDEHLDRLE